MNVAIGLEGRSTAQQVALWVAGALVERPEIEPTSALAVVDLLDDHCLLGRAVARELGTVESGGFGGLLIQRQHAMQELVDIQRAAIEELIGEAGPGVVAVLKGMATFGLTNEPASLRTGDVDLVVAAEVDVPTLLRDLGYRQTRGPFMHERGEFTRGPVEIDLHDHYPVMSLPTARASGRRASALGTPRSGRLSGAELLRTARPCSAPALRSVPVVEPEALAVIIATHILMNYVNAWSISHREKVYVRLGELLDVELLTRHPNFRLERFERLSAEVGAADATAFVQHLGHLLLERDLIPGGQPASRSLPPRCLWWDTWTTSVPTTASLLRRNWYEIDRLFADTGVVCLSPGATLVIDPATLVQPGVLASSAGAPGLWCCLHADGMVLEVGSRGFDPDDSLRLRIDGGSWSVEWSRSPDQALGSFAGTVLGEVHDAGDEASLRVAIPGGSSPEAFVGAAVAGPGVTAEATLVAMRWDPSS